MTAPGWDVGVRPESDPNVFSGGCRPPLLLLGHLRVGFCAPRAETRCQPCGNRGLLARAEYHTAIRRIHLAGASLREIAQALSLSHQRVQQIVSGAGGSWWRRLWRNRHVRPDAVCTWCERPPSEVAKLIAGPNVCICDACVESAERVVRRSSASGPFAPAGHVCTDCLRVCREILDGRS